MRFRRHRLTPEDEIRRLEQDIQITARRLKVYKALGKSIADFLSIDAARELRVSQDWLADVRNKVKDGTYAKTPFAIVKARRKKGGKK